MRLNQVTVPLVDYEASKAFYLKFGLELLVDSPPRYARFAMPEGGSTLSIEKVDGVAGGDWPLIWFESDRLDALVAELKAKGISFETDPEDKSYLWRVATLRDPAGNLIALYHAGENRLNPPWRVKSSA
jgi:catechol 2,3-dioxygenase-like lactoylglutathione lyase family enzyme